MRVPPVNTRFHGLSRNRVPPTASVGTPGGRPRTGTKYRRKPASSAAGVPGGSSSYAMSEKSTTPKRPPSRIARSSASPTWRNTRGWMLDETSTTSTVVRPGSASGASPLSAPSVEHERGRKQPGDQRRQAEPQRARRPGPRRATRPRRREAADDFMPRSVRRRRRGAPFRRVTGVPRDQASRRATGASSRLPARNSRASRSSERRRSAVSSPRAARPHGCERAFEHRAGGRARGARAAQQPPGGRRMRADATAAAMDSAASSNASRRGGRR